MNRLLLTAAQGDPIEKIYYTAAYLAQLEQIQEYYQEWQTDPKPHYWYKLYCEQVHQENILVSAVVNVCNPPFGAYVLSRWGEDEIEITPWLFSDKFDREEMLERIFSENVTEEDLGIYQRSLMLTTEFLKWMELREQHKADKAEELQSLRVAMIGHKRVPSREGGIEVVVSEMASRMAAKGVRVTAYNRHELFSKKEKGHSDWRGVRLVDVPTLENGKLNAIIYSVFASIRASFSKFDIYHFHAIGPCSMLWLPHLLGKRTVATIHGLDWQRAKWGRFASAYLRFGEKIAAKYADEVIVLSESAQRYFRDTYNRSTTLIRNGMERRLVASDSLINAKYGLSRGEYVLYLARIVPEKGLHYLIEAFSRIKTKKRLVIAGNLNTEGAYGSKIYEMGSKDKRVLFTGFVHGQELEELFANSSVYVLPSDVEGMPLSLLEAISYGARCLISDIPENVEAAKGSMRTFRHGDVASLQEQLEVMLQNEQPPIPLEDVWESWDEVTDQTLTLYHEVLERHSRQKAAVQAAVPVENGAQE